ncbi:mechanosensitive ion channel family protein [Reichenbachiella versicolor]|uniref:mechanosensitive ion channel family protein n=1 Tax=Reichenbachiella versicolor TaxID=1821036 RepID=UPI000D6E2CC3|nr:mechanosensitive ion channel domain-containing protein [Reichenbachiella versicolor]
MDLNNLIQTFIEYATAYLPKVAGALAVLIIGLIVVSAITKGISAIMNSRELDGSLKSFITSLVSVLLKLMLALAVMGTLGIEATSFVAVLGAAGLAVGMALSGTLQNFAGSVMIMIFKPFKVGDFIDAQGYMGSVKEIQIFNTILTTPDNKTIIIPNGSLANGSMTNFSTEPTRRIDWVYGIGYGDDVQKAREILVRLANEDSRILKDPEFFVGLGELADSSVNLTTRAWVNAGDYWDVNFEMNEKVYNAFNAEGINIPFPQMDVHVQNQ